MTVKDNSSPPISSFELQRLASIERNLVIAAGTRAAMRATTKWLRMLVLRSMQMARHLAAERRRRSAIRALEQLDDRMLKDIACGAVRSTSRCATDCPRVRAASRDNARGAAPLRNSALHRRSPVVSGMD